MSLSGVHSRIPHDAERTVTLVVVVVLDLVAPGVVVVLRLVVRS